MATDIFGQQPMAFGDAMAADHAVIMFAGDNGWAEAGILTTQMMLNYSQPVMRIFDFGAVALSVPASQYFVIGHPVGNGNLGQIMGPRPVNYCFFLAFGNACGVRDNNFMVAVGAGCSGATDGNFAFFVNHCLLTSFGFSVGAQDMLFSANLPFMFISLGIPDEDAFVCQILADVNANVASVQNLSNRAGTSNNNQQSSIAVSNNRTTSSTTTTSSNRFGPFLIE